MHRASALACLILTLPLICGCGSNASRDLSPLELTRGFRDAMHAGKLSEARGMIAKVEGAPEQDIALQLEEMSDQMASGEWGLEFIEYKQEGSCAVVVSNESIKNGEPAFDLDPLYLILQDGAWRISPDFTDYEGLIKLNSGAEAQFARLRTWFKLRKEQIYKSRSE